MFKFFFKIEVLWVFEKKNFLRKIFTKGNSMKFWEKYFLWINIFLKESREFWNNCGCRHIF